MSAENIIAWGGYLIILALVFAETGLLLGLVLPGGETLVFTAGLLVSTGTLSIDIYILLPVLIAVAIGGDMSGYFIGKKMGSRLYHKKDTWYFKKEYVHMAESFLNKHRKKSMILGKFLPVVRPFMPLMWGVTKQPFSVFTIISIVACIVYMSAFSLAGFFLGRTVPAIQKYIHWILPVSIIISLLILYRQVRAFKKEHRSSRSTYRAD